MLEGKAGMAAALSVMGSSAISLPALALPPSGPSLQRLTEAADLAVAAADAAATGSSAPGACTASHATCWFWWLL